MIDYKLVQIDGIRIITGQELKDRLTGFTIPTLPTMPPVPVKPVMQPGDTQAEFDARYMAWFNNVWVPYTLILNERSAINSAFEQTLRTTFHIATWFKTGVNNPDGTPQYGWVLKPVISPPYGTFAQKITGLKKPYQPKTLDWICFKTMYT